MSLSHDVRIAAPASHIQTQPPVPTSSSSRIDPQHRLFVEEAVRQLRSCHSASTDACWLSAGLIAAAAQVTAAEGRMLEQLLRERVSTEPRFKLLDRGIELPVLDDAERMLALNEWADLASLAVDPNRRATRHYRPDLIAIEKETSRAILIDVKRSLSSYSGNRQLNHLKSKMLAAALVAPQILYTEHQRTMVTRTEIAIVDLADSRTSYGDGIFGLCHLDALLGMTNLASDLQRCRALYRDAVDAFLRDITKGSFDLVSSSATSGSTSTAIGSSSAADAEEDDTTNDKRSSHFRGATIAPVGLARLRAAGANA